MHRALMIDNETLSLRPDALLLQVGVGMVDLDTGDVLYPPTNFWLQDEDQGERHMDPATVRWWMQQKPEVIASVAHPVSSSILPVGALWDRFVDLRPDTVWAAPAAFDLPQIRSFFRGRTPWTYKQERCLSTLWRALDPDKKLAPPDNPLAHNAASDVDWQMRYLVALWQKRIAPHLERAA